MRNHNLRRARRRMRQLQRDYARGRITFKPLVQRLQSWEAHLLHGDTYRLRHRLFAQYWFVKQPDPEPPPEPPE